MSFDFDLKIMQLKSTQILSSHISWISSLELFFIDYFAIHFLEAVILSFEAILIEDDSFTIG